jgi:hypothetical protein
MRTIAVTIMTLSAVILLGCSQKTEALAHKSLMAHPLLHQQTTATPKQDNDSAAKPAQTATTH